MRPCLSSSSLHRSQVFVMLTVNLIPAPHFFSVCAFERQGHQMSKRAPGRWGCGETGRLRGFQEAARPLHHLSPGYRPLHSTRSATPRARRAPVRYLVGGLLRGGDVCTVLAPRLSVQQRLRFYARPRRSCRAAATPARPTPRRRRLCWSLPGP